MSAAHGSLTQDVTDRSLGVEEFAGLFGVSAEALPEACQRLILQRDFRYRVLGEAERDQVLLEVLRRVDSGQLTVAGTARQDAWEQGWAENLESFRRQGRAVTALVPKYIRAQQPVRLNQQYVMPMEEHFELNWLEVFQQWLFRTYVNEATTVYEFGCGSGINLAALATLYPEKRYVGLDWAASSTAIIEEMAHAYGWNMQGRRFDFFHPDEHLTIDGGVVLTVGALEQTGRHFEAFLQYLLKQAPALCIHIEPIVEWYDERNLVDYAAIRFHRFRNYLEGFSSRLTELERQGRVEILKLKRSYFGSLFLEGYSQVIWRPARAPWT